MLFNQLNKRNKRIKEYHKESKSNGSSTYERDVTIGYERCNE